MDMAAAMGGQCHSREFQPGPAYLVVGQHVPVVYLAAEFGAHVGRPDWKDVLPTLVPHLSVIGR